MDNPNRLSLISDILSSHNLVVSNINANTAVYLDGLPIGSASFEPSLSNSDRNIRRRRVDFTFKVFDVAQAIGADTVSITSGILDPAISRDSQIGFFVESLRQIIAQAESRGIRVGIEPEPGLLIGTTEQAGILVDQIGSPNLGINWDSGHAVVAGENLPDVIRRFGSHFFNIHIEDIRDAKHYHLIPGEGDMNFNELFTVLSESGYNGFFTVELYTYRNDAVYAAKKAFSFLSAL
jgi:sugar phosphate isomerase/epimerase